MNHRSDADWVRRLQEMEAQIERDRAAFDSPWFDRYRAVKQWFQNLSKEGQIAAFGAGAIALLFVLKMTMALISLAVSVALCCGVGYIAYKFFWPSPSNE